MMRDPRPSTTELQEAFKKIGEAIARDPGLWALREALAPRCEDCLLKSCECSRWTKLRREVRWFWQDIRAAIADALRDLADIIDIR